MNGRAARVAGVLFAIVAWSITHVLTHEAITRAHHSGADLPGVFAARLALGAAALTLVSAVAAVAAGRPGTGRTRGRLRPAGSLASPAAFVGAEAVTHIGADHAAPRIALLVVAIVVHAAVGSVCHQLWSTCLGWADRTSALMGFRPWVRAAAGTGSAGADRSWATGVGRGRAPSRGPPRGPSVPGLSRPALLPA